MSWQYSPERFADLAQEIATAPGCSVTIYDRDEIKRRGMGGIVGVSQGAAHEPRFIHISYRQRASKRRRASRSWAKV